MTELNNILPVVSFYDLHASEYNSHMSVSDNNVRTAVRQCFRDYVSGGKVLDFGGGTGLDLSWLSEHYEEVLFLEPSVNMRAEAHKVAQGRLNVFFVEDNIDFNSWGDNLPFSKKVNGVIANFAVFNCIGNISALFEKLALVCSVDSYMVVTVINTSLKNLFKSHSFKFVMKAILNQQIEIANNQKGISHITYLHTVKQYILAAKGYFELVNYQPIPDSNFMILIFKRDE